jgi:hypothetical protein
VQANRLSLPAPSLPGERGCDGMPFMPESVGALMRAANECRRAADCGRGTIQTRWHGARRMRPARRACGAADPCKQKTRARALLS